MNKTNSTKKKSKNTVLKKAIPTATTKQITTHLYLNDKQLTAIGKTSLPETLTVLYLHNNAISKIENIDSAINLKCLYLQKNRILKIENLYNLKKLQKLYLGHNEIAVVEGLEKLSGLEELHIEKQRLSSSDALCFDPRTVISISNTLRVLNISHNNLTSISVLNPLKYIKTLNASFNNIQDIKPLCFTVSNWYYLVEALFTGNPIAKQHRYRENLIAHSVHLSLLDNKDINATTRTFMKRFEEEKLNKSSKLTINLADHLPSLPQNYPVSVQKAISQSILKHTKPCFDNTTLHSDVDDIYLPWKAMPKSASNFKQRLTAFKKPPPKASGYSAILPYFNSK